MCIGFVWRTIHLFTFLLRQMARRRRHAQSCDVVESVMGLSYIAQDAAMWCAVSVDILTAVRYIPELTSSVGASPHNLTTTSKLIGSIVFSLSSLLSNFRWKMRFRGGKNHCFISSGVVRAKYLIYRAFGGRRLYHPSAVGASWLVTHTSHRNAGGSTRYLALFGGPHR